MIQNCVGARKKDSWKGWKCKIDLVTNKLGTFLVIEDEGTEGLTGPNLFTSEIEKKISNEEEIPATWRLARFSSRNVSGGNQTGAGKFGVGKSVYSACSIDYDYCFDSLREDGLYVANRNEAGRIFEKAYEGDEAKNYIKQITGMPAKTTVGSRIIIINPKKEIINSINNGEMFSYIQESWWRCIDMMPDGSGIFMNGMQVTMPDLGTNENSYELSKPYVYAPGYRVKKFGFFVKRKDNINEWRGISYYRKGMRIGLVDIADIPNAIKDRFWGYIEVDKEWEELLSEIEDAVHYGVKSGKKHTKTYQNLRLYISEIVNRLLVDWGYIKDKEHENKKLKEALKELTTEVQNLFDNLGFEDLGKGAKLPDFSVRWRNIVYPHEGNLTVLEGDVITFGFRISNNYITDRKFSYSIDVISKADDRVVSSFLNDTVMIKAGEIYDRDLNYKVSSSTATRFEENRLVLRVKASGNTKEKRKEIPFFFDTEKNVDSNREVILTLHSIDMPHENSRRVDFGDSLKNITYLVENKRSFPLEFSLNVSIHSCEEPTNPKIMDIGQFKGAATPYEEVLLTGIPDIVFLEDQLSEYLESGTLEIRARLIALADSDEYEKGDRITHYYQRIFLNKDDKSGKEGSFEARTSDEPENFRRSWCKGGSRYIFINSGHPAYKVSQANDEEWKDYIRQEMLKQFVLLYLEEGKYAMFGNGDDITIMDPIDASKCVLDKIEEVYQRSFK